MELKQAMEAATAELDVRPGSVGDVMVGDVMAGDDAGTRASRW